MGIKQYRKKLEGSSRGVMMYEVLHGAGEELATFMEDNVTRVYVTPEGEHPNE